MRSNTVWKEKIRDFLSVELTKFDSLSVVEKVFIIYSLFEKVGSNAPNANQRRAEIILNRMQNPRVLFNDLPRNSKIGNLTVVCEFRRQLLNYLRSLVPPELLPEKEADFRKAFEKIQDIEREFCNDHVRAESRADAVCKRMIITLLSGLGFTMYMIYFGRLIKGSPPLPYGFFLLIVGSLLFLGASAVGAHMLWTYRKQKNAFKLFTHSEPSESTPLMSSERVPMQNLGADLFPPDRLMRVAVGKISRFFVNEDLTHQLEESSMASPI